jgi:hypothetical protein
LSLQASSSTSSGSSSVHTGPIQSASSLIHPCCFMFATTGPRLWHHCRVYNGEAAPGEQQPPTWRQLQTQVP